MPSSIDTSISAALGAATTPATMSTIREGFGAGPPLIIRPLAVAAPRRHVRRCAAIGANRTMAADGYRIARYPDHRSAYPSAFARRTEMRNSTRSQSYGPSDRQTPLSGSPALPSSSVCRGIRAPNGHRHRARPPPARHHPLRLADAHRMEYEPRCQEIVHDSECHADGWRRAGLPLGSVIGPSVAR